MENQAKRRRLEIVTYAQISIETRQTQPPRVSHQAGCIDESRRRCRPNTYEASTVAVSVFCSVAVSRVTRHTRKASREKCSLGHVTPQLFSIGHVTPLSVLSIGHVTRKSVLYGESRTGGAFDPPTQNTICTYTYLHCSSYDPIVQRSYDYESLFTWLYLLYMPGFSDTIENRSEASLFIMIYSKSWYRSNLIQDRSHLTKKLFMTNWLQMLKLIFPEHSWTIKHLVSQSNLSIQLNITMMLSRCVYYISLPNNQPDLSNELHLEGISCEHFQYKQHFACQFWFTSSLTNIFQALPILCKFLFALALKHFLIKLIKTRSLSRKWKSLLMTTPSFSHITSLWRVSLRVLCEQNKSLYQRTKDGHETGSLSNWTDKNQVIAYTRQ